MDFLVDHLVKFESYTVYSLIFGILLACGLGLPIPEDVTLFAAGLLAYYDLVDLPTIILVCFVGILMGDTVIYFLGAHFGRKLTKRWFFHKLLPDERLNAVSDKFKKWGNKLIFAARFMPGLRAPIFFSAGTLHLPFPVFLLYDGMAALVSVPTIIGAIYFFGEDLDTVVRVIKKAEHGILLVVFAVIVAVACKWYLTYRKLQQTNG